MAAGGLAVVLLAPRVIAEPAPSSALQPIIGQLLDAQHQVIDTNSGYAFITPADLPLLQGYSQNLALAMLSILLSKLSADEFHDVAMPWAPYPLLRLPTRSRFWC